MQPEEQQHKNKKNEKSFREMLETIKHTRVIDVTQESKGAF